MELDSLEARMVLISGGIMTAKTDLWTYGLAICKIRCEGMSRLHIMALNGLL
jgi:hypothetical protein